MNKWILLGLALWLGGCCGPCDKQDYGLFELDASSLSWMGFSNTPTRLFGNIDGQEEAFTYFDQVADIEELQSSCETDLRCGICCEQFSGEYIYVQLASASGARRFDISLRKDFIRNPPNANPSAIQDYISISMNSLLTCEITDLTDASLDGSVDLDGQTFANVLKCEVEPSTVLPNSKAPVAFYFSKQLGIVGFEFEGEAVYRLKL